MDKTSKTIAPTHELVDEIYTALFSDDSIVSSGYYRIGLNEKFIDREDNKNRLKELRDPSNIESLARKLESVMIDGLYGLSIEEQFSTINTKLHNNSNLSRIIEHFSFYDYLSELTSFYENPPIYNLMDYYRKSPKNLLTNIAIYALEDPLTQISYSTLAELEQDENFLKTWLILDSNKIKIDYKISTLINLLNKLPKKLLNEIKELPIESLQLMKEKSISTRTELENFLKPESEEVKLDVLLEQFTRALATTLTHDKKASLYFTLENKNVFYLNCSVLKTDSVSYAEIFEKLQHANVPLIALAGFIHGLFYPRSISRTGDLSSNNKFINAMLQKHDIDSVINFIANIVYDYNSVLPTSKEYFDFFSDKTYDAEELLDYSWLFSILGNEEQKKYRSIGRELVELRNFKTYYMKVIEF